MLEWNLDLLDLLFSPVSAWICSAVSTSQSLAVLSHDAVTICLPDVNQSAAITAPATRQQQFVFNAGNAPTSRCFAELDSGRWIQELMLPSARDKAW